MFFHEALLSEIVPIAFGAYKETCLYQVRASAYRLKDNKWLWGWGVEFVNSLQKIAMEVCQNAENLVMIFEAAFGAVMSQVLCRYEER